MSIKQVKVGAALLSLVLMSASCTGSEEDDLSMLALLALAPKTLSGTIEAGQTVTIQDGTTLVGHVVVKGTLNVPAGATIKGSKGSNLFVLQGGKLNAIGTSSSPIVFTSSKAAGERKPGDWGGIVLVGNAQSNASGKATEGGFGYTYTGGTNDADSSGTLQYVRIEFAGDVVGEGDELNCLSMYAVGYGTTIDHVQCHLGSDDSFEWFGGAVGAKYLLATGSSDDDFDADMGYRGRLQYLIGFKYPKTVFAGSSSQHGFEMDGSDGGGAPVGHGQYTNPHISNVTLYAPATATDAKTALFLREGFGNGASARIQNVSIGGSWTSTLSCTDNGATSNPVLDNLVYTAVSETVGNCTKSNVAAVGAVIASEGGFSDASKPNFVPGGNNATGFSATSLTGGVGSFSFTTATGRAGMDTDWTTGWTTYVSN